MTHLLPQLRRPGPTGAVVAAATTSLPETPGGERNWDYRYSWIRDSTFALWGLYTLGFDWEANDYLAFIADVAERDSELQIMYGVDGERALEEQELSHLSGYEGARPVRIGNGAYGQRQHDMWGAVLDSVYLHTKSRDHLDERIWPILVRQVEAAIEHWREPDRGIWEVRGEPKHFTSSKVMCWVAADRGARLARLRESHDLAQRWQAAADEIHADICANALDSRGVFTQHYDTEALDASVLLMPLVRFLPADDERIRRTVLAIADELTDDGLVLRYRTEQTDDGLSGEEGSFTICSFWLVSALCEIGEIVRARRLCEKLLSYASPLGLYGEELDPHTGRHMGNFPQAFTHLSLINAVMHLIHAERHHAPIVAPLSPRPPLRRPRGGRERQGLESQSLAPREPSPPRRILERLRGCRTDGSATRRPRAGHNGRREALPIPGRSSGGSPAGRELAETARRAEGVGIDTLVIPDHLIPQLAPIPAMATIAAATERLRVAGSC